MFFLDVDELLEYELAEKDEIILKCGEEHYKQLEQKTIKSASTFENTVAVINYDMFCADGNYKFFLKTAYIFYIELPKQYFENHADENIINKIAYEDRSKKLESICNFKISLKGKHHNKAVNQIIKYLKEVVKWI